MHAEMDAREQLTFDRNQQRYFSRLATRARRHGGRWANHYERMETLSHCCAVLTLARLRAADGSETARCRLEWVETVTEHRTKMLNLQQEIEALQAQVERLQSRLALGGNPLLVKPYTAQKIREITTCLARARARLDERQAELRRLTQNPPALYRKASADEAWVRRQLEGLSEQISQGA